MEPALLPRPDDRAIVEDLLRQFPVVGVVGARQVGKSTHARQVLAAGGGKGRVFDLEDPRDIALLDDPILALEPLRGLVVLDEIQRRPDLFPVLRVLADRPRKPARFLVLGSASPDLLRQTSETLAGRIAYHELQGLTLADVGAGGAERLWIRGGFPGSFLAESDADAARWCGAFVRSFLERDLPALGVTIPPATLGRFWSMLAHYHAQTWNGAELARSLSLGEHTVRRYLDLLSSTFVVTVLPPWHANISKRQVRSPRVYIADSGLLHALLGTGSKEDLERHPKLGASWEGFAMAAVLRHLRARPREAHFWSATTGPELDLLVVRGVRRAGFEFKRSSAPTATRSMHAARDLLGLEEVVVVHAGAESYPMAKGIRAVALTRLVEDVKPL